MRVFDRSFVGLSKAFRRQYASSQASSPERFVNRFGRFVFINMNLEMSLGAHLKSKVELGTRETFYSSWKVTWNSQWESIRR